MQFISVTAIVSIETPTPTQCTCLCRQNYSDRVILELNLLLRLVLKVQFLIILVSRETTNAYPHNIVHFKSSLTISQSIAKLLSRKLSNIISVHNKGSWWFVTRRRTQGLSGKIFSIKHQFELQILSKARLIAYYVIN